MTDEVESVDSLTIQLLLSSVFYLTTAYGGAFPCRNGKPFVLRTFPLSREYLIKTGEALICSFVGATHAGCQGCHPLRDDIHFCLLHQYNVHFQERLREGVETLPYNHTPTFIYH